MIIRPVSFSSRRRQVQWLLRLGCLLVAALLPACQSVKVSEPPRTALELLLLSTAADRALADSDFTWLNKQKVFVEDKYFDSYDKGNVISLIRNHLSAAGALLVKTDDKADTIVEIRSGGLGMNTSEFLLGLPAMAVPVPLSGPVQTPELAIYKNQKADSYGKFALFAYERESGAYLQSTGNMSGHAHFYLSKFFGVSWKRTDVPEFLKPKKKTPPPAL